MHELASFGAPGIAPVRLGTVLPSEALPREHERLDIVTTGAMPSTARGEMAEAARVLPKDFVDRRPGGMLGHDHDGT